MPSIREGAKTVIREWLRIRGDEKLLILTDDHCRTQAKALKEEAVLAGAAVQLLCVPPTQLETTLALQQEPFSSAIHWSNTIIGAATYSLLTTKTIQAASAEGRRYLSLPLSTTDGEDMLCKDFLHMPPTKAKEMAEVLLRKIRGKKTIHVTTPAGTDLHLSIEGRRAGSYTGNFSSGAPCDSSCFEVYIAPREDQTNGTLVIDASMGYIGAPKQPLTVRFRDGKIVAIEDSEDGKQLKDYLSLFSDDRILIAAEFGMGLNTCGSCTGGCYIEDESTYGTFHIGIGRNLTLGGENNAPGHTDLVAFRPTIRFDEELVYQDGEIVY